MYNSIAEARELDRDYLQIQQWLANKGMQNPLPAICKICNTIEKSEENHKTFQDIIVYIMVCFVFLPEVTYIQEESKLIDKKTRLINFMIDLSNI